MLSLSLSIHKLNGIGFKVSMDTNFGGEFFLMSFNNFLLLDQSIFLLNLRHIHLMVLFNFNLFVFYFLFHFTTSMCLIFSNHISKKLW